MKRFLLSTLLIIFVLAPISQAFAMTSVPCLEMSKQSDDTFSASHDPHAMHKMMQEEEQAQSTADCCGSADSCPMPQCSVYMPAFLNQTPLSAVPTKQSCKKSFYKDFYSSNSFDTPYRPPIQD